MPRAISGKTTRRRHKKVLKTTKGHYGARHAVYRTAKESMIHALDYAYRHRREKKGDFRRLWIARINAAARQRGMTYSELMGALRAQNIQLNRKMLADLAVRDPDSFDQLLTSAPKPPNAATA
ncbi:MAG: 50S ribosomal protein L20 [Chloroflexota bacterium]